MAPESFWCNDNGWTGPKAVEETDATLTTFYVRERKRACMHGAATVSIANAQSTDSLALRLRAKAKRFNTGSDFHDDDDDDAGHWQHCYGGGGDRVLCPPPLAASSAAKGRTEVCRIR